MIDTILTGIKMMPKSLNSIMLLNASLRLAATAMVAVWPETRVLINSKKLKAMVTVLCGLIIS